MKSKKINPFAVILLLVLLLPAAAGCRRTDAGPVRVAAAAGPELKATAAVDRGRVTIGDQVKYTITVVARPGIEIEFTPPAETLSGFAVRDFGSATRTWPGKRILRQWRLLDTYKTGEYELPPVVIKYGPAGTKERQQLELGKIKVVVESLLDREAREIKDIRGPVGFPPGPGAYLLAAGAAALVVFAAIAFLRLRRRNKRQKPPAPRRPAHEIARELLDELRRKDYPRQGKIKEFYFELSQIVRHYLEDRFRLRAPEMTTEEFLGALRDAPALSSRHKGVLREFLSHCDLVKFARYGPSGKEIEASFSAAEDLIEQTKETAAPSEAVTKK